MYLVTVFSLLVGLYIWLTGFKQTLALLNKRAKKQTNKKEISTTKMEEKK